jgi:hypothetical protein
MFRVMETKNRKNGAKIPRVDQLRTPVPTRAMPASTLGFKRL